MNTKVTNQNIEIELPKVSARDISKYLLWFDQKREYFSDNPLLIVDSKDNYKSRPIIGNFRLNKMLQIIQALYYAHYKKCLFWDKIKAYEHGGVVSTIRRDFKTLHKEADYIPPTITEEQKDFISKVFPYLRDNYSDRELRELAHEDLAWQKARRRKLEKKGNSDEFIYDEEVLDYYEKLASSMLRVMGIKVG